MPASRRTTSSSPLECMASSRRVVASDEPPRKRQMTLPLLRVWCILVMARIRWSGLPSALRDHLFDRLRERKITAEDLYQLKAWRKSNPDAPDGLWYKGFG